MAEEALVKVIFRLERDEDDYPPVELESLWGIPTNEGVQLDNIPFYARGVSFRDIVATRKAADGALEFESVVKRGGHSTYRLLLLEKQAHDPQHTIDELVAMGLGVEEDLGCLLAVDVPPEVAREAVLEYFKKGIETGRWEVEEACTFD